MKILEKLNINSTNIELYKQAFTHTSYSNEHFNTTNYERLEFLGDAILELIISEYLYLEEQKEEGEMTKIRASYVCEEALATYAKDLEFESDVLLGTGELKPNDTILADIFEAFTAALYLDKGFIETKKIIMNIMIPYIKNNRIFLSDYKSHLQELVQTRKKSVEYRIISETGPAHNRHFVCEVIVGDIVMGKGSGSSKKIAEQNAAKAALSKQAKI